MNFQYSHCINRLLLNPFVYVVIHLLFDLWTSTLLFFENFRVKGGGSFGIFLGGDFGFLVPGSVLIVVEGNLVRIVARGGHQHHWFQFFHHQGYPVFGVPLWLLSDHVFTDFPFVVNVGMVDGRLEEYFGRVEGESLKDKLDNELEPFKWRGFRSIKSDVPNLISLPFDLIVPEWGRRYLLWRSSSSFWTLAWGMLILSINYAINGESKLIWYTYCPYKWLW